VFTTEAESGQAAGRRRSGLVRLPKPASGGGSLGRIYFRAEDEARYRT